MVSLITAYVAAGLLAAAPASFSFDGVEAEAHAGSSRAFIATGPEATVDSFLEARGEARAEVRERINVPVATYGDQGRFEAELRAGVDSFRISLDVVGAPPSAEGAPRGLPFAVPIAGGVRLNQVVLGGTGMGPRSAPARAAFVLFGRARIERNGVTIAEDAPVQILALATGVHADDDTHRRLPAARGGDTELIVYAPQLESGLWAQGYFYAVFEDVSLEYAGRSIPSEASVAVSGTGGAGQLPEVAQLSDVPPLAPPAFEGFAEAAAPDAVPLAALPFPETPQPLNATPATPLPETTDVPNTATGGAGPTTPATLPAVPLPQAIPPANTTPDAVPPPGGPTVPPANAAPATPLITTPSPAGATPGTSAPPATGTAPVAP